MPYLFVLLVEELVECNSEDADTLTYCIAGVPCFRVKI